jgi:hypothetical protein
LRIPFLWVMRLFQWVIGSRIIVGTMFCRNVGIRLTNDLAWPIRTEFSATPLREPEKSRIISYLEWRLKCSKRLSISRVHKFFQKPKGHPKILDVRRVRCSKFHTEDPSILGATATWQPGFVHPWSVCLHVCGAVSVNLVGLLSVSRLYICDRLVTLHRCPSCMLRNVLGVLLWGVPTSL